MNDRIIKTIKRAEADEQDRKDLADRIAFSRLPEWMQANEIGDRLRDGSDEQEFDYPEDRSGQSL